MDRSEMIALLHKLKKPHVAELGDCVAGFDLEVATKEGAGTACCAWGSRRVEGPSRLTKRVRNWLAAHDPDADDEPPNWLDEDEIALAQAMIRAKCKPGVAYYHVVTTEEGDRFFSTNYDKVYEEWTASPLVSAELTPWDEVGDADLEEWITKLGLNGEPRRTRKARTRRGSGRRSTASHVHVDRARRHIIRKGVARGEAGRFRREARF